jgi:error-prone DNA polymerase
VAASAPALLVRGTLERVDGVVNVVADRIEPLPVSTSSTRARNFR